MLTLILILKVSWNLPVVSQRSLSYKKEEPEFTTESFGYDPWMSFLKIGHKCAWIWKLSIMLWTLDIFSTFSTRVNIWYRGRHILNLWYQRHINYAEERLIYKWMSKGLPSFHPNAQFLQTTGKCFHSTKENHWNSFNSIFSAIFSRKRNIYILMDAFTQM